MHPKGVLYRLKRCNKKRCNKKNLRLSGPRYRGATPQGTLWVNTAILNSTRTGTRSLGASEMEDKPRCRIKNRLQSPYDVSWENNEHAVAIVQSGMWRLDQNDESGVADAEPQSILTQCVRIDKSRSTYIPRSRTYIAGVIGSSEHRRSTWPTLVVGAVDGLLYTTEPQFCLSLTVVHSQFAHARVCCTRNKVCSARCSYNDFAP